MDPEGIEGAYPPPLDNASFHSSMSRHSFLSSTTRNQFRGEDSSRLVPVILRISPANDGDMAGYIHLDSNEIVHHSALVAYFTNAGRTIEVISCSNFDEFLADHSLLTRNVSFLMDLPEYILESGRRLLANKADSSSGDRPDLSWLPKSLSSVAPPPSSRTLLPQRSTNLPSSQGFVTSRRPDPVGIEAPIAPSSIAMGGSSSIGHFSPLTTSEVLPFRSFQGSSTPRGYIFTQRGSSVTAAHGSSPSFHPTSGASVMSSLAGSMIPTSSESSDSATLVAYTPPPAPLHPLVLIKDKPSDMGIKIITDKDSWMEAKKIIDARLRRAPYWPGDSKALITTSLNAAASVWWEEVIAYYCKPPVSDLFVEEHRFDGKGFEMIAHIDQHFNPSGAVDSLSYIFDLIDIKQTEQESVVTLKARFSKAFSSLKMGGIGIDSALQVGFMLRALLGRYHAVVQEFRLGRHSLSDASLQTVVDQCTNYDKDPWKGPVGRDGKAPKGAPSANLAGADSGNPYELLAHKSFNHHFGRWKRALREEKGSCLICHGTARNPEHLTCDCPILKNVGYKLEKRLGSEPSNRDAASRVETDATTKSAPAPAPSLAPESQPGSASVPGAFTASTENDSFDSGDEFDYEGKSDGAMYGTVDKSNAGYAYLTPSCCTASVQPEVNSIAASEQEPDVNSMAASVQASTPSPCPFMGGTTCKDPQGVNTVYLPKTVLALLKNPPSQELISQPCHVTQTSLLVADTGATDHMLPDKSAFISYHPVSGRRVRMGNNSFAPILGYGTAVISLNGKKILIRDCLHVPDLRNPLYSLRAHQRQRGCGFIGMYGLGMHVFFPTFIIEVNTATDCHLRYVPIGRSCGLPDLDYVQPKFLTIKSSCATASSIGKPPATIEPDDNDSTFTPTFASHWPKKPPSQHHPPLDLSHLPPSTYVKKLKDLDRDELIQLLYSIDGTQIDALPQQPRSTAPLECMDQDEIMSQLHHSDKPLPPVRPCDTSNPSDTKSTWTAEELHRITGCRRFRNYRHLIQSSRDGTFIDSGEFPASIGSYATIPKAARGKPIDRTLSKFLDIVHIDIAFGDCLSTGGYKYALIFVDRATRYNWCFGLKSLQHNDIIAGFMAFRAEAGRLALQFRCDCDEKLFGSHVRSFLHLEHSSIVAAPAGRQSANGLVESHWKIMVHMSRAYLTEKQMPRSFWYYAVKHSARMMNMIPGRYKNKLASPFMLAHGVRPDQRTWIPIFSLCYFHHEKDSDAQRSKTQAHTMDGIIIGRSTTSNAILVYNPRNQRYYEPDSYKIDPYRLPTSVYPTIIYDGGLFVSLHRGDVPVISEPYPPGTRVEEPSSSNNTILRPGTVMDIPLDPTTSPHYLILFDDGSTKSVPARDMPSFIPKPSTTSSESSSSHLLPPFLRVNSKITYEHEGQYHKGYLTKSPDGVYLFSYKSHVNKKHPDWSVPLPNLPTTWHDLCAEGILYPGHSISSFTRDTSLSSQHTPSTSANFVSAASLLRDCPRSLLTALAPTHPDRDTWLRSFNEEKDGIRSEDTYDVINLAQYRALRARGAPPAIPTMCLLTVKPDELLRPHRAKARIVVLGNHEDRLWTKSDKYAPVLRPDSLRLLTSMAVERRCTLKQGDCKNAFCQGILPPEEITIVKPPIGDPDAIDGEYWLLKRTLYGLRRSPKHWYDKIRNVLLKLGLRQNAYDPCLFSGDIIDPSNPNAPPSNCPLTLGLYVDDFVYFSEDPDVEARFENLLHDQVKVDFMGTVEWFLGTHFQWMVSPDLVQVHLSQTGFASHLVESNSVHLRNVTPDATPYRSGLPIDACPESDEDETSQTFIDRKKKYQSIIGSIGWLAQSTRPDLTPSHSFLSAYNNKPSRSHLNAALYVLQYIHSTIDYGFSYTSAEKAPLHTYMTFPHSSDTEAYIDAIPPRSNQHHRLTTYSDACWGSQIGNAIREGFQLPLFKFRSMSGAIIFRSGGPIIWKTDRQERTSLSSCEAEIRATNMGSRLTVNVRNMILHLASLGYPITDAEQPSLLYNDNEACVKWCHNLTTKGNRHIEHRENATREWVEDGTISVEHVSGKYNPSDIFTKEMRDGANFRRLRDSFMSRASTFLKGIYNSLHPLSIQPDKHTVSATDKVPTYIPFPQPGLLDVLLSHRSFHTPDTLSCLSNAGRYILSRASLSGRLL